MIRLSISNIAWDASHDSEVYRLMKEISYSGLEIAPTRIFPEAPYDRIAEAGEWAGDLKKEHGLSVPSMQSIWYGRKEALFGGEEERRILTDYTMKAIDFAEAVGCRNLVFGCPRNRNVPDGADPCSAVSFFRELGEYAREHNTVLAMEANPPIYNTNYINDTAAALDLIEEAGSAGFLLNLDVGTMIENGEQVSVLEGRGHLINHVHISEPGLKVIEKRELHKDLIDFLKECGYDRYISIEMGKQDDLKIVENTMIYLASLMG